MMDNVRILKMLVVGARMMEKYGPVGGVYVVKEHVEVDGG